MVIHKPGRRSLILLASILLMASVMIVGTSSQTRAQAEPTATPDAEGVIYVVVQPNDSLWALSVNAGISLQELLAYNNLNEDAIIQPGQILIIGFGTPAPTATVELPTAAPTATRLPPTPTQTAAPPPRTAICLKAFTDTDRDGVHDAGEPFRTAVAFTVFNEETVVGNYITDGVSEPYCLDGLAPGEYKVTRSVARDETLTTAGNWALTLTPGSVLNLEFGSYQSVGVAVTVTKTPLAEGGQMDADEVATPPQPEELSPDKSISRGFLIAGFVFVGILLLGGGLLFGRRSKLPTSRR